MKKYTVVLLISLVLSLSACFTMTAVISKKYHNNNNAIAAAIMADMTAMGVLMYAYRKDALFPQDVF